MASNPSFLQFAKGADLPAQPERPFARDIRLDHMAQLATDLSGLGAALVWFAPPEAPMGRWGVAGLSDSWADVRDWVAALVALPGALTGTGAQASDLVVAGRPVRHVLVVPVLGPQGQALGGLAALGLDESTPLPDSGAQLARLSARVPQWLAAELERADSTPDERRAPEQLEARLRSAMRAMQMGSWIYDVDERRLQLSADAAAILQVAEAPSGLDPLLLQFTDESARRLRRAFLACIRDGKPIDEEVQFKPVDEQRRWMRLIGDAAIGAQGGTDEIHGAVQDVSSRKQAQEDTLRLAMRLTTTLASITEAFVTLDRDGQFMYVNGESEQLLGHATAELLGEPIWKWLPGRQPGLLEGSLRDALARNHRVEFEDFYPGLGKWLEVRAYPYAEGLAVYFRDVSQRRAQQEQLTLLQTGIAHLNDVVVIAEPVPGKPREVRIAFVNDAFERLSGFARAQVVARPLAAFRHHGADTQPLQELLRRLPRLGGRSHSRRELPFRRADGSTLWVDLDVVPVHDRDGALTHWVAVGRDVSERKAADDKIHHLAFFDPLTQLPNRQLLIERLQAALDATATSGQHGALMFIDLDNFKVLNDTMGHHKGDLLLQRVAERLRRSVRKVDTVARLGGDEFVVMLQHLGTEVETAARKAQVVAEKVLARMIEPFDLGGSQHYSTTSIGVTPLHAARTGQDGVNELLKQADLAMYQAKNMGRNTVAFFDPEMQAAISASASMSADLRAALHAHGQIGVHYQPQFDLGQRVVGAEALARWQHPERGSVSPSEFIPIAEDTGLILPLGTWVMEESCRQLAAWGENPDTALLSISVNVSVRQFRHPEFVDLVMGMLARHGVQPHLLKLELTESLLADRMEITLAKMGKLKQLGVTLSLDDFGTGYSSLAYLKLLPIDQLKIDKAFVADVLSDPSDAAIAHAIIGLAHSVGLTVIAEGVENEAQRHWLAERGCDLFQGFLLAQPMPVDEVNAFLKTHTAQRALQLA